MNRKMRIAVQNKGRLMEPSLAYLRSLGLRFEVDGRNLIVGCEDLEIELLFVRNTDIPEYVKYNVADFGIVGENVLMEKGGKYDVVKRLGFGKCSLVIAKPVLSSLAKLEELEHERIATSYPRILKNFLKERGIKAAVIEIAGSVEICPSLDLADAIFDITQSGETLRENGLIVMKKVLDSEAVLIKNINSKIQYEDLFL